MQRENLIMKNFFTNRKFPLKLFIDWWNRKKEKSFWWMKWKLSRKMYFLRFFHFLFYPVLALAFMKKSCKEMKCCIDDNKFIIHDDVECVCRDMWKCSCKSVRKTSLKMWQSLGLEWWIVSGWILRGSMNSDFLFESGILQW